LTARLKAADALMSDNVAYASHAPRSPRRVLLVSAGNPFLEKLLAVDPVTNFQFIGADAWQAALAEKFETVIFDRVIPAGFDWKTSPGNFFFIGASPFEAKATPIDRPLIAEVSADDPITRNVGLQNVTIQKALAIAMPADTADWKFHAPLRGLEHPLLIAGNDESRRIVVLSFDVLESDLPLRIAFPLLISNVLQWLDPRDVEAPVAVAAGDIIPLKPGQLVSDKAIVAPAKTLPPLRAAPVLEPLHNGYYLLGDGEERRWVAANTFSAAESDLRQTESQQAPKSRPALVFPNFGTWPLWTWLTLAALVLFTGEWWSFHRRKTE
jgi:hypothetical protein